jgi:phosphate transport system protein
MGSGHTDRTFEGELLQLRDRILAMAGQVEQMIRDAILALTSRDADLARRTIAADPKVNRAEIEIDELCVQILAKRQPVASDLRFVTLALKMVTDLERIGDVAVNLCERAISLADQPQANSTDGLSAMAEIVRAMVRDAIDAFIEHDAGKAHRVLERDDEVDELYHLQFRQLLAEMRAHPESIERGIALQSAAKYLERIGDHATNLAEHVLYLVEGQDMRHRGKLA